MPDLEAIKDQIVAVNGGKLADFVSLVKHLPDMLQEDETVEKVLEGSLKDDLVLVVATDWRLVLLASTIHGKDLRLASLAYDSIRFVQGYVEKTFWSGTKGYLRILDAELKETVIGGIYKYDSEDFARHVQHKVDRLKVSVDLP